MKQRPPSTDPQPSHRRLRRLLGAGSVAALLLGAGHAAADDLSPPPPNVLLLVDSSGSMDYKTGSNEFPTCKYSGANDVGLPSERSRWIELVEVLTGSVNDYQCQKLDRNSTDFRTEFALGGNPPYDALYANPYHRAVNDKCVAGPGALHPTNPALFPSDAIKFHQVDNLASTCTFNQTQDGLLDSLANDFRFGLMTFDTNPSPATDVNGLWSYFLNNLSRQGEPAGCLVPQDQEVGVRNPSAPPWEGRAVGFGDPAPGSTDFLARNDMIQKILLATRPYGATPIAGMLDDARGFLLDDTQNDPLNASFTFGPKSDLTVYPTEGNPCRKQAVILLSDGQPNMDLRPFCEPGGCPYQKAEDIALALKNVTPMPIYTYVIGFAMPKVVVGGLERTCDSFADSDFDTSNPAGICATHPNDSAIQACCALNRIAAAGGKAPGGGSALDWRRAQFANNRSELRRKLQQALGDIGTATTRTPAVPAAGSGFITSTSDRDFAVGFRFGASIDPDGTGNLWTSSLTRQRYVCEENTDGVRVPELVAVTRSAGDDFAANLNTSGPASRTLYTVLGADPVKSDGTMRPNLPVTVNDGVGTYTGTQNSYTSSALATAITPAAIQVDDGTCDIPAEGVNLDAAQCRDQRVQWWLGIGGEPEIHRCGVLGPETCALLGDILNSTPRPVAGRPSELIVDSSYDQFRTAQIAAKRPAVLYAASNDGFLHAFKIAQVDGEDDSEVMKVKSTESNELWAFIPPAVLPGVPSLYPGTHQLLLDGQMAIKDVVATFDNSLSGYKYRLQRSKADAETGGGTWRTILVQSFGAARPGYYALDITDPVPASDKGPRLLWQLITDKDGNQLFGTGGGTPLITTVFIGDHEVPVAVLPGGHAPPAGPVACTRKTTDFTGHAVHLGGHMPRTQVPCYTTNPQKLARSLTVVRLDSGEVLRTFRQDDDEVPALKAQNVVSEAPLDSPMTGQPVPFPSGAGAVADRVFIGDQDGALWRLNLASASGSPADWKLDLFFDTYPGDGTFNHAFDKGQPIETPPIISVDEAGNLTVAVSTGRQYIVGAAPQLVNYVWSLTEVPTADRKQLLPKVNWYRLFPDTGGERVIGTMALFNSHLYFTSRGEAVGATCKGGDAYLHGMHYTKPHGDGPGAGGLAPPSFDGRPSILRQLGAASHTTNFVLDTAFTENNATLSGLSVAQVPTCSNAGPPEDNEYFNYGTHNALGDLQGGNFQLLIPLGSGDIKSGVDAQPITLGEAKGMAVDIPAPPVGTRVDSWAAIVE